MMELAYEVVNSVHGQSDTVNFHGFSRIEPEGVVPVVNVGMVFTIFQFPEVYTAGVIEENVAICILVELETYIILPHPVLVTRYMPIYLKLNEKEPALNVTGTREEAGAPIVMV